MNTIIGFVLGVAATVLAEKLCRIVLKEAINRGSWGWILSKAEYAELMVLVAEGISPWSATPNGADWMLITALCHLEGWLPWLENPAANHVREFALQHWLRRKGSVHARNYVVAVRGLVPSCADCGAVAELGEGCVCVREFRSVRADGLVCECGAGVKGDAREKQEICEDGKCWEKRR